MTRSSTSEFIFITMRPPSSAAASSISSMIRSRIRSGAVRILRKSVLRL